MTDRTIRRWRGPIEEGGYTSLYGARSAETAPGEVIRFQRPAFSRKAGQLASSVEELIDPRHRNLRHSGAGDRRKVLFVLRQIGPLRGFRGGQSLLLQAGDFGPDVTKVGLEIIDLGFIGKGFALA